MNRLLQAFLTCFLGLSCLISVQAQVDCVLNCQDHVYISFNSNCDYLLEPVDLTKNADSCDTLVVSIVDYLGRTVPNPITADYRGQRLTVSVADTFGNSCWGYVTVEDKNPPMINVQNDTISCFEEIPGVEPPPTDCKFQPKVEYRDEYEKFLCDDDSFFVGIVHRTVWATDPWGNTRKDTYNIYIERITLDSLVCPPDTVIECCKLLPDPTSPEGFSFALWSDFYTYENKDGYRVPKIVIDANGQSIGLVDPPYFIQNGDTVYLNTNYQHCNVVSEYKDHVIEACGASYKVRREWLIKDWCTDSTVTCVQWFKIVDTSAPVLFYSEEFTPVQVLYTKPHECLAHVELKWPTIYNDCVIKAEKDDPEEALKQFKVRYEMDWYDPTHPGKYESRSGFIEYGETVIEYVPRTGLLFIKPYIQIRYFVADPCWNEAEICQTLLVYDQTPPTPVCDEITQVTLDPESCWVRIYAKDLDDGSHDNCDDSLFYAVATMTDIEYWRNYWNDQLMECYEEYHYHRDLIDRIIDEWIDLYVFKEHIDIGDCNTDSLVMRVYEGLNTPPYDPHVFKGTRLEWYNWFRAPLLRYNSYRCNYVFHYDSLDHYNSGPFYPDITCDDVELGIFLEAIEDGLIAILDGLNSFDFDELNMTVEDLLGVDIGIDQLDELIAFLTTYSCENLFDPVNETLCIDLDDVFGDLDISDVIIDPDITTQQVVDAILAEGFDMFGNIDLGNPNIILNTGMTLFGDPAEALSNRSAVTTEDLTIYEFLNILYYFICYGDDLEMKEKVFQNLSDYPELLHFVTRPTNLVNTAYSGIVRKNFLDLPYYNDCMVVVYKDDKEPPVCIPPANRTIYCDGLEESGSFTYNNDVIYWNRADFAHFICNQEDYISSTCALDDNNADDWFTPTQFCFKAPWDGGDYGYYGGPYVEEYNDYKDNGCGDNTWGLEHMGASSTWAPMYCRVWLLLDQFDDPNENPTNFNKFFGTPTYKENCPDFTVDSTTVSDLDECGTGYLTRTWTIMDGCGNSNYCEQSIYVKPRSDFEVIFPEDIEIDCEMVDELVIGEPIITDKECELIGVSYEDQVFELNGVGCYKIARTWKIINWCTFSPDIHNRYRDIIVDDRLVASDRRYCVYRNIKDNGDGYMEYLQVIKVVDRVAPELTCEESIEVCNYDDDCEPDEVVVDLGTATDNCTDDDAITYSYIIKPEGSTSSSDYIYGHGNQIQNVLPFGDHDVYLIAWDGCGNSDTCEIDLLVRDCKNPTPYCYDGIATVIMPSSGSLQVWARDLDAGSFDNCTADSLLRFTFTPIHPDEDDQYDEDELTSYEIFTCDDIPNSEMQLIQVTIYVWDEDDNVDFCTVGLLLQDGSGDICSDISASNGSNKKMQEETKLTGDKNKSAGLTGQSPVIQGFTRANNEGYGLYQNRPNPYRNETIVSFSVPKMTKANLRILDLTGKLIFEIEGTYSKGYHEWKIDKQSIGVQSGMLYYQLKTDEYVATKKMIIVN